MKMLADALPASTLSTRIEHLLLFKYRLEKAIIIYVGSNIKIIDITDLCVCRILKLAIFKKIP